MKPRYLVIAPMPFNKYFEVGDIITLDYLDEREQLERKELYAYLQPKKYYSTEPPIRFYKSEFDRYPHLFRPLRWWEEREAGMMPEYVKCVKLPTGITVDTKHIFIEGAITRITEWRKSKDSWVLDIFPLFFHFLYYGQFFTPATPTQYERYIKNLKK